MTDESTSEPRIMSICRLFALIAIAFLAGCGSSPQDSAAPSPPEEIAEPTPPDRSGRDPQAPDTYEVRLDTTEGDVVIQVDRSLAPRGADRFYRLVKEGFYDGAKFFRVVDGFVVQFGIPADPKRNAEWTGAVIRDDPVRGSNSRGTITFATSGPNSRTTQVFINLADNPTLDDMGFSPFGKVVKGMDVVEKFYAGYGEGPPHGTGPDQSRIEASGNAYLEKNYPELDAIKTARIVRENGEPVEPSAKAAPAAEKPAGEKPAEEKPKPAAEPASADK